MSRDTQLKERWEQLVNILSNQFSQGEDLDLDAIIYLIGVQELGKVHQRSLAKPTTPIRSQRRWMCTLNNSVL